MGRTKNVPYQAFCCLAAGYQGALLLKKGALGITPPTLLPSCLLPSCNLCTFDSSSSSMHAHVVDLGGSVGGFAAGA